MTDERKRIFKTIGKVAAYTAITGGSYLLARGVLSLLLRQMDPKDKAKGKTPNESPKDAEQSRAVIVSPPHNAQIPR